MATVQYSIHSVKIIEKIKTKNKNRKIIEFKRWKVLKELPDRVPRDCGHLDLRNNSRTISKDQSRTIRSLHGDSAGMVTVVEDLCC